MGALLFKFELELEVILSQMAQKQMLRGLSGLRAIAQKGENGRRGAVGGGVGHQKNRPELAQPHIWLKGQLRCEVGGGTYRFFSSWVFLMRPAPGADNLVM